jgi:hypothetical protein
MRGIIMKTNTTPKVLITIMAILTMFSASAVLAATDSRQVWLANSPVLRIRNDAGGYSASQRVNALQLRANALVSDTSNTPVFTVRKYGNDANIYADNNFFMTVTPADARANMTTTEELANTWARRLAIALPGVKSLYQPSEGTPYAQNVDSQIYHEVSTTDAHIVVPKDTVIPVVLDKSLSSATSKVGGTFYAHQEGTNASGFPEQTIFTGRVVSVSRASGKVAGQIGVNFVSAKLPDGSRIPITGRLTSLDESSVSTDADTGRLTGKSTSGKADSKFIAYGAGAGLVIGEVIGKKAFLGTLLGAAAGYFYGQKQAKPAVGRDVQVAAGTAFGILLMQDAAFVDTTPGAMDNAYNNQ